MFGECPDVLPWRQQFGQSDIVGGLRVSRQRFEKSEQQILFAVARLEYGPPCDRDVFETLIKCGTKAALTSDDLPDPLEPDMIKKAVPSRARLVNRSAAVATTASRPKKIGACSNS